MCLAPSSDQIPKSDDVPLFAPHSCPPTVCTHIVQSMRYILGCCRLSTGSQLHHPGKSSFATRPTSQVPFARLRAAEIMNLPVQSNDEHCRPHHLHSRQSLVNTLDSRLASRARESPGHFLIITGLPWSCSRHRSIVAPEKLLQELAPRLCSRPALTTPPVLNSAIPPSYHTPLLYLYTLEARSFSTLRASNRDTPYHQPQTLQETFTHIHLPSFARCLPTMASRPAARRVLRRSTQTSSRSPAS